jgi:peptidoglycan/LPS O-acetylase OafA/YrhL
MGVILDHAGVSLVRSGYAGVDIFFAISGFLIGGIVARELDAGAFSFRAFYARRARRILPALFAMILATLPVAWALMTPEQLRYFGGGAFAAVAFLSNVWFFHRIDYFNPEAAEDPLVHTWSLGVEEQFYLMLPMLLVATWRWRRATALPAVVALAAASLGATLALVDARPQAAFYLIWFRAWELLLGVAAALAASGLVRAAGGARDGLSAAGLALAAAGLFVVPEGAAWPGSWALLPVGGTLLVLVFGRPGGTASRLLGLAPLVAIGLVSYSAYLWHQPILGFLAIGGHEPRGAAAIAGVVLATLLVAAVSWRLVEQPFRRRTLPRLPARTALALAAAGVVAFALGGHVTKGYPSRMSPEVLAMLDWSRSWSPTYRSCISGRDEGERLDPARACVHGAAVPPRVAIWGDSHAAVLAGPLGDALAPHGLSLAEMTVGSCVPISGLKNSALKRTEYCDVHNRIVRDYLAGSDTMELVVMNAYWNSYAERRDFDTGNGFVRTDGVFALPVNAGPAIGDHERLAFMADRLRKDVAVLTAAGKHVLLLYPIPESAFDPPDRLARALWIDGAAPAEMGFPAAAFEDYSRLARALLDAAGDGPLVHRLDVSGAFCDPGGDCRVVEGGVPLFFNANHLSLAGAGKVVPPLAAAIGAILD